MGCPVLASNWGGHADLSDEGSFLFDLNSEDVLAKAIDALRSKRFCYNYNIRPIGFSSIISNTFLGFKRQENLIPTIKELDLIMRGP